MNKNSSPFKISVIALGMALNIVGAFIALTLRLPIYLDSIGTIMVSFLMGPSYGIITGVFGSLVSGITFDVYSIYFAPVQIFTGFLCGVLFNKGFMKGFKMVFGVLIVSVFSSLVGAIICAYIFGGITSSGSSYIVAILSNIGVNKVLSVFIVQFLTDYADKFVTVSLILVVINAMPFSIKQKLKRS